MGSIIHPLGGKLFCTMRKKKTIAKLVLCIKRNKSSWDTEKRLLRSFEHVQQLNWVRLAYQRIPPRKGDCVATISKFYSTPIWSFNPCQITSSEANIPYSMGLDNLITRNSKSYREGVDVCVPDMTHRTSGRYSEVVFSTLHGHMIAGVEAMRVYTVPCYLEHLFPCGGGERKGREPGNADIVSAVSVVYEIESLSRGSGLLGNICMPLLRPLQSKFMRDSCSSFLALMQNSSKI